MKKNRILLTALLVVAVATLVQAQNFYPVLKKYSAAGKEKLDKVYAASLRSGHNGIIEETLSIVTMIKLDVPADEFLRIEEEIEHLMVRGGTPAIRYKAYLANVVYDNPDMFKEESLRKYENPDALFSALATRMSKVLFSSI